MICLRLLCTQLWRLGISCALLISIGGESGWQYKSSVGAAEWRDDLWELLGRGHSTSQWWSLNTLWKQIRECMGWLWEDPIAPWVDSILRCKILWLMKNCKNYGYYIVSGDRWGGVPKTMLPWKDQSGAQRLLCSFLYPCLEWRDGFGLEFFPILWTRHMWRLSSAVSTEGRCQVLSRQALKIDLGGYSSSIINLHWNFDLQLNCSMLQILYGM